MTQSVPLIRIKYGWLLAGVTSEVMHDKYSQGEALGTYDQLSATAKKYEDWWRPYNDVVLQALCTMLDLQFRQNIIDIYVSPWFSPISDPMVIGPAFKSKDSLINTIVHELIHRLLTDNTSVDYEHDFVSDWKELFGDKHDWNTLIHIPVHATMKKLYLEVLDRSDLFELDQDEVKNNKPYADAWLYVNDRDYDDIIRSLRISRSS